LNIVKQITNTAKKITTNPLDPNSWKGFAFGQGGTVGVVVSTVVLEFLTQFLENRSTKVKEIMSISPAPLQNQAGKIPLSDKTGMNKLNSLDLRDIIVLAPSISSGIRAVKDKGTARKNRLIETGAGIGTKIALRALGLNPNPQVSKMLLAKRGSQLKTIEGLYP
jgi:hypothetical protein